MTPVYESGTPGTGGTRRRHLTLQSPAMPRLAAILLLSLSLAFCAARGPRSSTERPQITGLFSSMRFVPEAEDVVGMEVFITYATNGMDGHYYVHFQDAGGVPDEPALVRASVVGHDIEFTVPEVGTFKGKVRMDAIEGKMTFVSGNEEMIRLPRKKSYWQ